MRKKSRLIAFTAAGLLLLAGGSPALAAPDDTNQVSQSSVIKTSSDLLEYQNMIPGTPMSQNLTITNVSGKSVSITPSLSFDEKLSTYVNSGLDICLTNKSCVPVTAQTKLQLEKDETADLKITLDLIDKLPSEYEGIAIKGGIQIYGEVKPDPDIPGDSSKEIVPDDESELAITGAPDGIFKALGTAGVLMIVGTILFFITRKKPVENI